VSSLASYILRTVLGYTMLVLVVLIALGALFLFIGQQDDIGTGGYTVREAAMFVALNLPSYVAELLPVATLIGTLLGLGHLATGSELVVMRASGISTLQFCRWLAIAGVLLAAAMVLISEFVAPPLEKYARQLKVFSKYNEFSFAGDHGTWVRDGDTIISVEQQSASTLYGGIHIFRFDPKRSLYAVGRADSARVEPGNRWVLQNYTETQFANFGTSSSLTPRLEVRSTLTPEFLGLAVVEPAAMGLRELRSYIAHLEHNDLDATSFEIALWARAARVVALVIVVILALPFALGPMRSAGQGARTVIGILIGAAYVLLSRTLESSGQLFDVDPWIVGCLPAAMLALFTGVMLTRVR
jgi:lipopolysaccharide export system permease protein